MLIPYQNVAALACLIYLFLPQKHRINRKTSTKGTEPSVRFTEVSVL